MKKLLICIGMMLTFLMASFASFGDEGSSAESTEAPTSTTEVPTEATTEAPTEATTEAPKSSLAEITKAYIVTGNYTVNGEINQTTNKIAFNIPYGYSNEKVTVHYEISPKATIEAGSITNGQKDVNLKSSKSITVIAEDGSKKVWTLNSSVAARVDPKITIEIDDITTSRTVISVSIEPGNETISKRTVRYYASGSSKSNAKSKTFTGNSTDVTLSSLSSNTKYYVYVELEVGNRTFTTSNHTFTTKKSSSSSGSSSGSSSSSSGTGLVTSSDGLRYRENSYVTSTWKQILGSWYYFKADGYAANGWLQLNNIWYYFDNNRMVSSDWRKVNNVWYYFFSDGRMAEKEWVTWNGKRYYLNPGGAMVANDWVLLSGKWYFLNSSGEMLQNSFVEYKGNRYWLQKDSGILATNERINVNEIWYNVNKDGVAVRIQ